MATGITIDEVTNTLDDIQGTEKIPVSSGISEPEVVTTGDLKDYINGGMQEEISDLSTIRSGASAGATAYQKPSSGIPSTDLASAVQTSLGKADTALQSFTETDPTVPSWAKSSSKPSYNYSEISGTPTLANVATSGSYNDLTDKPSIPDSLSDLSDDSTHRVVTDTEKSTWSAKSDFSGSYNDLTDKPTIPAAQVQSDWSESDNTKVDYIKNKPTLGVGSSSGSVSSSTVIGIPAGGNAGQVLYKVDGSTDYSVGWTNQTQNYPSAYCTTSGSTAAKKANCSLYAAQANSYLHVLIGSNNISASALTLNINSEGAKPIYINGTASSATNYTLPKGTYIVFYDGTNYYFRTDGKIQAPNGTLISTSSTSGLIKNDGTIDTTSYGTYSKPAGGIPASDIASGVIPTVPSNIVTGSSQSYTIWSGTQAQYDALATKDNNTIYLIKES